MLRNQSEGHYYVPKINTLYLKKKQIRHSGKKSYSMVLLFHGDKMVIRDQNFRC